MSDTVTYQQFFCTSPSVQVITPKGGSIVFVTGRYVTKNPDEIEFLQGMCKYSQHISQKAGQETITGDDLDPMKALKAKFYAEFLAEQQAQMNPTADRGKTVQGPLNAQNTRDIQPVTLGAKK